MKKLMLKVLVLSLFAFTMVACGTTEEAYFIEEDPAVSFSDEGQLDEAEVVLEGEPSPTVPVVVNQPPQSSLPPAPTPATPGVTEIKVEIRHAMGQFRPGVYTFAPNIVGGVAPLEASWGCTSPDSKCPNFWVQRHPNGFPTITGEFLEGHYQIDLSVRDDEENRASASYSFEIVAPNPPSNNNNPVDLQTNFPNGLEGGLTLELDGEPLVSGSQLEVNDGVSELTLQEIYQDPQTSTWSDGLAHISYIPASSELTLYQALVRSSQNPNRLAGEIRVRFPRRVRYREVNRIGSFVEVEMTNFFPTDWVRWDLKGCLPGGSCRFLKRNISLQNVPGSSCDPDNNTHCEKALNIEVNEDELPTGNFNAYEKFQISVQGTNEADYQSQDGQIRTCSRVQDCLASHPYCVAGVCSAIYPGDFLETNQL